MHTLERQQWVPRPIDETFEFFSKAENLELITPEWMGFHILTPTPITMSRGTLIDYRIKLRGLPLTWRTRIEEWKPGERFVDTQLQGPYDTWIHTHTFTSLGSGTLLTDVVDYKLPMGIVGRMVHTLTVQTTLTRIFDHRYNIIRERFGRIQETVIRRSTSVR